MQSAVKTRGKPKHTKKAVRESINMGALAVPGVLLLLIFNYAPMFGIVIAFKRYVPLKGIWGSQWCGLDNFKFFFTSQDALRTIRNGIYADWFDKGLFSPDGITTAWDNYTQSHMMDPISSVFCPKEMYGSEERVANTYSSQWGFDVVAINVQPYNFIQKNWGAGGNGISSTCKHPEEAAKLLEAITSGNEIGKKIYNTMVFGIEGKHYEFVDKDNDRIRTFEYDGSQGGVDTSYAGMKWILGNSFNAYKNQAVLDDQYPVAKELNESPDTVASALIGFTPDTSRVQTQIDQVNAVTDEYYATLVRGVLGADGWEAYFNEYVAKLKVAGIDKVIDELQSQLDAFLSSQK